ncbi:MAG TPA: cytochrome D1 domain-containing protein [Deferrisomatales bacterium]|nr:cytochrome D1 domain-containing protein [Deferrisomatales bacterium]
MKATPKPLSKLLHLLAVLAIIALASAACAPAQSLDGEGATPDEHGHAEGEADDHSHDDEGGSTTIGDSEVKIDHHGNPVFDDEERVYEQIVQEGVSVEFTIENFLGVGGRGGELAPRIMEGEHAVLQFHLTDAASGAPLAGLRPAVWLDLGRGDNSDEACRARVQGYLGGTLEARPMVDLNSYFILGMNKDNTLSVIDPMVDVAGMTNLFAVILLQGAPQDWAMTDDQLKLFVTMPELGSVALVDLDGFQVVANIQVDGRPQRIDLQPDGRYAWAGVESQDRRQSGVAAIDVAGGSLAAQIPTGAGAHSLAFSPDSRYAYVTNSEAGTLTVIDTQTLKKVKDLSLGSQPVSVAVAASSGTVYVADQGGGFISVVDGAQLEEIDRWLVDPGLAALGISPDGKWGFAANPQAQKVYVFETAAQRITHAVPVKGAPDQVAFTPSAAYLRSSSTPAVFAIPFDEINPTGNISVLTVPIGEAPPDLAEVPALADAIAVTPDNAALLISNPADDKIYFYIEGAQSAAGGYQGHTLVPRAVQIIDRSLNERSPGVYTGGIRIPRSGDFSVAFMLSDPQVVHCFQFTARPNPELSDGVQGIKPELKILTTEKPKAGVAYTLQLEMTDADSGEPLEGAQDLLVLAMALAGNWSQRATATELGDGVYQLQLTFPNAGMYNLFFMAPSQGLGIDYLPPRTIQVTAN